MEPALDTSGRERSKEMRPGAAVGSSGSEEGSALPEHPTKGAESARSCMISGSPQQSWTMARASAAPSLESRWSAGARRGTVTVTRPLGHGARVTLSEGPTSRGLPQPSRLSPLRIVARGPDFQQPPRTAPDGPAGGVGLEPAGGGLPAVDPAMARPGAWPGGRGRGAPPRPAHGRQSQRRHRALDTRQSKRSVGLLSTSCQSSGPPCPCGESEPRPSWGTLRSPLPAGRGCNGPRLTLAAPVGSEWV
jgi:hypothetical protein